MEGWVDLCGWLYTDMIYLSADSYPSKYRQRPDRESNPRPIDRKCNVLTAVTPPIKPPWFTRHYWQEYCLEGFWGRGLGLELWCYSPDVGLVYTNEQWDPVLTELKCSVRDRIEGFELTNLRPYRTQDSSKNVSSLSHKLFFIFCRRMQWIALNKNKLLHVRMYSSIRPASVFKRH